MSKGFARKASAPLRKPSNRFSTSLFEVRQDDRNIADVAVALDVLEHRDTIHLRHHHIAYHKVVFAGEQHLQTFLAVAGMFKAVPVAQFGLDVLGNLVVIVNY